MSLAGRILFLVGIFGAPLSLVVGCAACGNGAGGLIVEAWLAAGIFFLIAMAGGLLTHYGRGRA